MDEAYELFKMLPDDLKREVLDYIEFLLERRGIKRTGTLKMEWKGALKELRDRGNTILVVEHDKSLEWWG